MNKREQNIFEKVQTTIKENLFGEGTKKKPVRVQFDKGTENPFVAEFSERGFLIDGTRLSFETIEDALSKEYTLTLGNGTGRLLDAVKMQKILKYKDVAKPKVAPEVQKQAPNAENI
jgi:hypothetical protein